MSPERRKDTSGYYYTKISYNHDAEVKIKEERVTQDAVKSQQVATAALSKSAVWGK